MAEAGSREEAAAAALRRQGDKVRLPPSLHLIKIFHNPESRHSHSLPGRICSHPLTADTSLQHYTMIMHSSTVSQHTQLLRTKMGGLNGKSELSRFYIERELIVYKFVNSSLLTLTFRQSFRSMSAVAVLCIVCWCWCCFC